MIDSRILKQFLNYCYLFYYAMIIRVHRFSSMFLNFSHFCNVAPLQIKRPPNVDIPQNNVQSRLTVKKRKTKGTPHDHIVHTPVERTSHTRPVRKCTREGQNDIPNPIQPKNPHPIFPPRLSAPPSKGRSNDSEVAFRVPSAGHRCRAAGSGSTRSSRASGPAPWDPITKAKGSQGRKISARRGGAQLGCDAEGINLPRPHMN